MITHNDATQSVGLIGTNDQSVAEIYEQNITATSVKLIKAVYGIF